MKRISIFTACTWLSILTTYSQAPQAFEFQGVARNAAGDVLGSQLIGLRLSIVRTSPAGTVAYQETHTPTTNAQGLFTVNVGGGTVQSGTFATIDWGTAAHFLKVEMDPTGGTSYSDLGTTQLLSVPYALFAGSSNGWGLTGNTGTSSASNFIGTTDVSDLVFRTNNVERMRISTASDGRVGINAVSGLNDRLVVEGTTSGVLEGISVRKFDASFSAPTIRMSHARGTQAAQTITLSGDDLGNIRFEGRDDFSFTTGADIVATAMENFTSFSNLGTRLMFRTTSIGSGSLTPRMVIDPSGNVGIGAFTPADRLHVDGSIRMVDGTQGLNRVMVSDANGSANWVDPTTLPSSGWGLTGVTGTNAATNFIGTTDSEDLVFRTNNEERMRIDDLNTRVGIGTNSMTDLLTVQGTTSNTVQGITIRKVDASTTPGCLRFEHSRGTPLAPEPILSGDRLGEFLFQGRATSNQQSGAQIVATATENFGATSGAALSFWTSANGVGGLSTRMFIDHDGEVGIGTTTPGDKLHVVGSIRMVDGLQAAGRVMMSDANGKAAWTDPASLGASGWGLTGNAGTNPATNFIGTPDAQSLAVRTNNVERMRIESATGHVGIGLPNPQKLLHLSQGSSGGIINVNAMLVIEDDANTYLNLVTPDANEGGILFGTPSSSAEGAITYNQTATPNGLSFRTNGNITRAVIDDVGNLGVGTAAPDVHLEVEGTGTQTLRVASSTATTGIAQIDLQRATNTSTDWRIHNTSGILTFGSSGDDLATVTDRVELVSTALRPSTDNVTALGGSTNRWTTVFASNGVINTSDARDKENVRDLSYGLKEVLRLRPVSFQWRSQAEQGNKLGLIAQDVQQVLPEVVHDQEWKEEEGGVRTKVEAHRLGVYYSDLIPVLVKAIQEQQVQIEAMRAELDALRKH